MIRNQRDLLRLEQFALVCSTENVPRSHQCRGICKVIRLVDVSVPWQQDKITPLTCLTRMTSCLLQILWHPHPLQNIDISRMNEKVQENTSFRSLPKGLMQMVHIVPEKTEASSAAEQERHYSSSLPASSKAAMIIEELWPRTLLRVALSTGV